MKKSYVGSGAAFFVAVLLLIDAISFGAKIAGKSGSGSGTALYLFFGMWEVNDRITYDAAPYYLVGLYVFVGLALAITAFLAYRAYKYNRT